MKVSTAFEVERSRGHTAVLSKGFDHHLKTDGYAADGIAPDFNDVKASNLHPNLGRLPKVFDRDSAENEARQRGVHSAVSALPFSQLLSTTRHSVPATAGA
jgi:hypothetical protein